MKVRGKLSDGKIGWYNNTRIKDGDEFVLNKKSDFSENWMEKVGKSEVEDSEEVETEPKSAPPPPPPPVRRRGRPKTEKDD